MNDMEISRLSLPSYEEGDITSATYFLQYVFARAGKISLDYTTDRERFKRLSETGAQRFKRKALGLCGRETIKSLEDMIELFLETEISLSYEDAKELVPKIVAANRLNYCAINRGGLNYMEFEEVSDPLGDVKYKIRAWNAD